MKNEFKRICYLVLAGEGEIKGFKCEEGDFVIAVDGGYEKCVRAKVEPRLVVGDFDSLGYVPEAEQTVSLNPVKEVTDTMAAVDEGFKRGYRNFVLLCALGGRFSHSLGNLSTLFYILNKGGEGIITDGINEIGIVSSIKEFSSEDCFLSLLPITDKCLVEIKGCRYNGHFLLEKDSTLGLSNETGKESSVKRIEGLCYYIIEKKT